MNILIPMQTLYWPETGYFETGVMLVEVSTGEPRFSPTIPLDTDAWHDGMIHPDEDHLMLVADNLWELRRLPTDPPPLPQEKFSGKGRIHRSYN